MPNKKTRRAFMIKNPKGELLLWSLAGSRSAAASKTNRWSNPEYIQKCKIVRVTIVEHEEAKENKLLERSKMIEHVKIFLKGLASVWWLALLGGYLCFIPYVPADWQILALGVPTVLFLIFCIYQVGKHS